MSKPTLKVVPKEGVLEPSNPRGIPVLPRTTRLQTLQDLKKDSVRLYRAMRKGELDSGELSRIMFSVGKISDLMEKADTEEKVAALEARINDIARRLQL